jgi:rod shape-determining protein MreB
MRLAGQDLDELIASYIRRSHNLLIGESTAELVKLQLGSAHVEAEVRTMQVKGRDLVSGVPRTATVDSQEIRECIRDQVQAITAAVRAALEITPPELSADIADDGIVLTGGGVQLRGLEVLLAEETRLPVRMAPEPAMAVVKGAGAVLDNLRLYREAIST